MRGKEIKQGVCLVLARILGKRPSISCVLAHRILRIEFGLRSCEVLRSSPLSVRPDWVSGKLITALSDIVADLWTVRWREFINKADWKVEGLCPAISSIPIKWGQVRTSSTSVDLWLVRTNVLHVLLSDLFRFFFVFPFVFICWREVGVKS